MPFTPKFVDMARNLTTVQSSAPVTLGSAVAGFTSIGDALSAGDQFYYCIQGVDKPAEREVGRGTMQANGTIVREAISGSLNNFSSGTKTIALVAAAEWFTKLELGGGGTGTGGASLVAVSVTELAAMSTAGGAGAILTAKGREGLFAFDSANLSALVAADTRKAIYVAPASAPTGASGAWVRKHDGPINVMWFGAAANFTTDDLPAFDAALALIKARAFNGFAGGDVLYVPAGRYYLGGTLNIHCSVHLLGAGSGQPLNAASLIRFAKNVNGIVLNHANTRGDGLGSQGSAQGSVVEGLQLWGGNVDVNGTGSVITYSAADSTSGHGVRIRGPYIECRDVAPYFFGGDGFNIVCTAGSGGSIEGNANSFKLDRCEAQYNRGHGYLIAGNDANAGTIDTCSAVSNGGGGFIEYSFLGNSYFGCHTRDNGVNDPTTEGISSGGPTGTCRYPPNSSTFFYVVAGQEAAASTTTPGTNAAVWRPFSGHPYCRNWASGLTWVNGSPYGTNPANVNGRNVFVGCYAESAQPPVQASYPTMFFGGLLDEVTVVGTATWLRGSAGGGIGAGEFISLNPANATNRTSFGNPDGMMIFNHQRSGSVSELRGRDDFFGKKALELRLDNSFEAMNVGLEAAHAYGYGAVTIARLFVGDGTINYARRLQLIGSLASLNGSAMLKGDLFVHGNAAPGEAPAYLCTTAGTYGSGAVLTALAPLGLAEASAAEIRGGSATARFVSPASLFAAAAPVTLTDGASVTIDGSAGINFNLTLGGNRTLANPTNMKPGQSGRIRIKQDATGGRTLAFGANWLFPGGDPVMSTAANAVDVIAYFVNSASEIEASIIKALV